MKWKNSTRKCKSLEGATSEGELFGRPRQTETTRSLSMSTMENNFGDPDIERFLAGVDFLHPDLCLNFAHILP